MSFQSVKAIVDSQRFDSFIGLNEDAWFDAKHKNPYDLDEAEGRFELAKDVCAFANAEGGFLVVGLGTDFPASEKTERVNALDPCLEAEFNVRQYRGVIDEYVYPTIRGLKVFWTPGNPGDDRGFGVVEIPPQSQHLQYFLIAKVAEAGTHLSQIVFGLSRRNGTASDPLSVSQLHSQVQRGKNPVPETLARLEDKIDILLARETARPQAGQPPAIELIAERIRKLFPEED
jgi:Schlafen, AlbA_2